MRRAEKARKVHWPSSAAPLIAHIARAAPFSYDHEPT
jgi:hypothetical protein